MTDFGLGNSDVMSAASTLATTWTPTWLKTLHGFVEARIGIAQTEIGNNSIGVVDTATHLLILLSHAFVFLGQGFCKFLFLFLPS